MDVIKIARVPNVQLLSRGKPYRGTLHLTSHHLIFSHESDKGKEQNASEMWVCFPIIHTVERRPPLSRAPSAVGQTADGASDQFTKSEHKQHSQSKHQGCVLRFRCRDFTFFSLSFGNAREAADVFETIRELTCVATVENLYAYQYTTGKQERLFDGWTLFSWKKEYERMGCAEGNKWRMTTVNQDFQLCQSYPQFIIVPTSISDNVLNHGSKYRSKGRIPALCYLHRLNQCAITRCAQPMVGLKQARSPQDERLITAIFETNHPPDKISTTQQNLIVDARPLANAVANQAIGAGSENMDHYKNAKKVYLGIENIHVIRESLGKVIDALKDVDLSPFPPNREGLHRSGWLKHIGLILEGTALIVDTIHLRHSHVVLHCSDGWDRTTQLSALAQICLDPYHRTLDGFICLIEKEWLSFGHQFALRSGNLSSEKFFLDHFLTASPVPEDSMGGDSAHPSISAAEATRPVRTTLRDMVGQAKLSLTKSKSSNPYLKDTSPIFHQFLDCVFQLLYLNPTRFEFNERFLKRLLYHLYSCQYGTFLHNNEKERLEGDVKTRTKSVWGYFLSRRKEFIDPAFDASKDDADAVLWPPTDVRNIRWWSNAFGRSDSEMIGLVVPARADVSGMTQEMTQVNISSTSSESNHLDETGRITDDNLTVA